MLTTRLCLRALRLKASAGLVPPGSAIIFVAAGSANEQARFFQLAGHCRNSWPAGRVLGCAIVDETMPVRAYMTTHGGRSDSDIYKFKDGAWHLRHKRHWYRGVFARRRLADSMRGTPWIERLRARTGLSWDKWLLRRHTAKDMCGDAIIYRSWALPGLAHSVPPGAGLVRALSGLGRAHLPLVVQPGSSLFDECVALCHALRRACP